jgi:tryptophan 6-halogenase
MGPIQKILIVGGGPSGWMTAALLEHMVPGLEITLIEASDIPILGVGESTNAVIRHFHKILGLDEKSFMRATNATYKLAIRFESFNKLGDVFYHPFGQPPHLADTLFTPQAQTHHENYHLAEKGNQFLDSYVRAYQLDAGLYGQYLKQISKAKGVRHIIDKVRSVDLARDGTIDRIQTEASGALTADLYIDCSGFRALLLGGALKEPFESVNRYLLADRAIAARVPYVDADREMKTSTNCTALSAGWVWNVPLWNRLGTGYVYSSAFLSKSEAELEYRTYLGLDRVKDLTFNHIEMRTGRHERAWVGNCLAIGISYGFLEPLESTGLSLTQVAILDVATALLRGGTAVERQMFNRRQSEMFDITRDFIVAHYALTEREDTPYWRYLRYENSVPESLANILCHVRRGTYEPLNSMANAFYGELNWNLILSGMGFFDGAPGVGRQPDFSETLLHSRHLREKIYDGEYEELVHPAGAHAADAHPMWSPTW